MKTIKQEEAISPGRFIDCPECKTHTLKLKRIVHVGRCANCHETYKIIVLFVRTPGKERKEIPVKEQKETVGEKQKDTPATPEAETRQTPGTSPISWEFSSDSTLFGSKTETSSGSGQEPFSWEKHDRDEQPQTSGGQ